MAASKGIEGVAKARFLKGNEGSYGDCGRLFPAKFVFLGTLK